MRRQTSLLCDVTLKGITHYIDEYQGSIIVQDRYFFVFHATNPKGELKPEGPRGKNIWQSYEEIKHSTQTLPNLLKTIDMIYNDTLSFHEAQFILEEF